MKPKPTLKDVAKAVNVSEMTASRALRRSGEVSDKTRERVEAAALELGYIPNRIAGSLASRSVELVGVVIPSLSSFVFPEVLSGISAGLAGSSLQPVFGVANYDLDTEQTVIREMLSWRPQGLIVAGLEHSDHARSMMQEADIPIVEIMDVDGTPVDFCVGVSHEKVGRKMAAAISRKGYRNIGFIGTKMPFDYRARKRFKGFTEGLREEGLELLDQELYSGGSSLAKGRELTDLILQRSPDIDCLYYSSDVMSAGGLMHCMAHEIDVPKELALAGFNGLELLDGLPRQLATANASRFEIGKKAAEFILTADQYPEGSPEKIHEFETSIDFAESL